MLKYCLEKWNKNKAELEEAIREDCYINEYEYKYIVQLVVDYILNDEENEYSGTWDRGKITVIDDGDYQGTLLFLIPIDTYQPSEYEYLLTFCSCGSCSGCDTLQRIQYGLESLDNGLPGEGQVKQYMQLCKDLVCNMVKPYNDGWREGDRFVEVEYEAD